MRSSAGWADLAPLLVLLAWLGACDRQAADTGQQIFAFGTLVNLNIYAADPERVDAVTRRIEARYRELDEDWYPWPRDTAEAPGELRRVNAALASGDAIDVSPALADLIRDAAAIEAQSGGKFNPAIGSLIRLWGFDDILRENWRPPAVEAVEKMRAEDLGSDRLEWQGNTLRSRSTAVQLDLGGIAKGAILELTVDLLREGGILNAIVDIGGDLTVIGDVHGRLARIGIRSPGAESAIGWIEVADGETVVTSGNYERYFEYDGVRYQHIIDPSTGYPVTHTASVTVLHGDPVLADAAATALIVAGMDEFDQTCAALGIDQAILIDSSGELRLTAAMRDRVNWIH